jgi:hypothetical protein
MEKLYGKDIFVGKPDHIRGFVNEGRELLKK